MKTPIRSLAIATVATALSLSLPALAGDEHSGYQSHVDERTERTFNQLDTDQDGKLTEREVSVAPTSTVATQKLSDNWSELDTNQDDQLDRSEFAKFEPMQESDAKDSKDGRDMDDMHYRQ